MPLDTVQMQFSANYQVTGSTEYILVAGLTCQARVHVKIALRRESMFDDLCTRRNFVIIVIIIYLSSTTNVKKENINVMCQDKYRYFS